MSFTCLSLFSSFYGAEDEFFDDQPMKICRECHKFVGGEISLSLANSEVKTPRLESSVSSLTEATQKLSAIRFVCTRRSDTKYFSEIGGLAGRIDHPIPQ